MSDKEIKRGLSPIICTLLYAHQLPKGLQVDEAVLLGNENKHEQPTPSAQSNMQTSNADKVDI